MIYEQEINQTNIKRVWEKCNRDSKKQLFKSDLHGGPTRLRIAWITSVLERTNLKCDYAD